MENKKKIFVKELLRNGCEYVACDKNGTLWAFIKKPIRKENTATWDYDSIIIGAPYEITWLRDYFDITWDDAPIDLKDELKKFVNDASAASAAEPPKYDSDAVNCPKHYQLFPEYGLEVIDALEARATPEEWRGYLKLTAMAYLLRAGYKDNMLQDIKKCSKYLYWLEIALGDPEK